VMVLLLERGIDGGMCVVNMDKEKDVVMQLGSAGLIADTMSR
jgi:hypothetical protein